MSVTRSPLPPPEPALPYPHGYFDVLRATSVLPADGALLRWIAERRRVADTPQ